MRFKAPSQGSDLSSYKRVWGLKERRGGRRRGSGEEEGEEKKGKAEKSGADVARRGKAYKARSERAAMTA